MALHAQQQILNALQALLSAGGTVAATRVFLDRVDPLQPEELPAILIEEADGETNDSIFMDGGQRRTTSASVHCVLAASSTAAADCRAFGLAVEKIVTGATSFSLLCKLGLELTTSQTVINGEGDRLLASRQQSWRLAYHVHPLNPDIINP